MSDSLTGQCRWCGHPCQWDSHVRAWRSTVDGGFKCDDVVHLWHFPDDRTSEPTNQEGNARATAHER